MKYSSERESITKVMKGLLWKKTELIDHLFSNNAAAYKSKWEERNPILFWCCLDPDNQVKTIEFFDQKM